MNAVGVHLDSPFYVTGGTLSRDALCYVTRHADHQLYDGLRRGQFSYVLTARQMGKSSLMVRTASRLRDEGIGVVVLDLTAIGQNLTAEQWYGGLLTQMAQQLNLEDELEEFWDSRPVLGPLQRWMQAVRQVVLPRYPGRVVVFIDEIDAVLSLPFSTDEFFAGIREFYNHRTEDPELEKLTFCLLGVAAPSDLIRDTRMTPFNIGQRIELHDFTEAEAQVLAYGLGESELEGSVLLNRILYWTGGHPYLTQRLCQAFSESNPQSAIRNPQSVDRLCNELFFARRAREQDDNLLFVRERMLRSEVDLAGLLGVYECVQRGRRVEDDETNPFATILKLSGITRIEDGRLRLRNRIYDRVFDQTWVATNMPDAEVRRQRAAYRKGLLRSAAIAAVIVVAIASLAFIAIRQRNLARSAEETNRQQLYAAHMNLAAREWQDSNIEHMRELLDLQGPRPGQNDLRGIDWYLLWALAHPERKAVTIPDETSGVVFSPDLKMFATSQAAGADVRLWDMATGTQLNSLKAGGVEGLAAFSPDGKLLAADSADHSISLWGMSGSRELQHLEGHTEFITDLVFSSDSKILASTSLDRTARLWQVGTGNLLATLKGHTKAVNSAAFSPDGMRVATASTDLTVKLWDISTGKELRTLQHPATMQSNIPSINRVAFSPDGSRILATGDFLNVAMWDAQTGKVLPALEGHHFYLYALAFSPDGRLMATGSDDRTILLWDVGTWSVIKRLTGHGNTIFELAFSADSNLLASASFDNTIKLWDVAANPNPIERQGAQLLAYSPDGRKLVSTYLTELKLWDTATWKVINTFGGGVARIISMAYSVDGKTVAFGTLDNTVILFDIAAGKERFALKSFSDQIWAIAFSPDGMLLATLGFHKIISLWDLNTGEEVASLEGGEDVKFSPDGRLLASASDDLSVCLWDVATRQLVAKLKGHTWVKNISFSPNGKLLATTSADGSMELWDVAGRKDLATLKGHAGAIFSPVFSPDGKRLATAGQDFTVRLWDVATGQELATLRRHTAPAWSVAFSPDGKTLVSSGRDGRLNVWRAATEDEVQARAVQ